jgi:hypothetical protein
VNVFKVVAPAVAVFLLMGVAVATADAEQGSTGPILINVYTTDCTDVADIDGCYDVYLCADHPEYNERIVGIEVVEDCVLVLEGVNPTEPAPNPSVPAVTPEPIVISFTG